MLLKRKLIPKNELVMSVSLYLMGCKGLSVLQSLIKDGFSSMIDTVIVSKDNNVQNDYYNDIFECCLANNIQVFDRSQCPIITSEYSIAISWRWLIKGTSKLIVLHDSLLPRYRGFAPLVNMLINKEPAIGVTAIFANDDYDTGDILFQEKRNVSYPIKIYDAINLISDIYNSLAVRIFKTLLEGRSFIGVKQLENNASYSLWRDEDDYRINWNDSASNIQQFIYSVGYPYKGACTQIGDKVIRITDCLVEDDVVIENRQPGKVVFVKDDNPIVVCKEGLLKITQMFDNQGKHVTLNNFRVRFK